jgi:hypothetical protein
MKALTLPSGQDSVTVYTSDGSAEVMLLNKDVGGGTSVPLSRTRYVDINTSVATPDQSGAATAPFKTILQALTILTATFPGQSSLILCSAGDYRVEGPLVLHDCSIAGLSQGDSVSVQLPAVTVGDGLGGSAVVWLANVECLDGATGVGSLVVTDTQLGTVSGGALSVGMFSSTGNGTFNGVQLLAQAGSSLGYTAITIQGNTNIELSETALNLLTTITFTSPGGLVVLDSFSAFQFHQLSPAVDLNNGQPLVRADQGGAILTVAIPALANGELGYANVSTVGTELEGIGPNDVVVGNPRGDLGAAGAGGGAFVGCRVSAADTIRCAFVGALAGGNSSMQFGRVTRIVPPPA